MILITLGDNTHEDVRMILFSFSLENYVTNQFINTHAYNITTFSQLQDVFMEKLGEKYNAYLLDTLRSSKINENETTEELNKIFIQIFQNLNQKIKPLGKAVCLYHFDVFLWGVGISLKEKRSSKHFSCTIRCHQS
jgi:hypothetical protein